MPATKNRYNYSYEVICATALNGAVTLAVWTSSHIAVPNVTIHREGSIRVYQLRIIRYVNTYMRGS